MLSKAKLMDHYWGGALYMEMHVLNVTPIINLNNEVLDKFWFGKNIKYDHLRVINCKNCVRIPKNERYKLDAKSK